MQGNKRWTETRYAGHFDVAAPPAATSKCPA